MGKKLFYIFEYVYLGMSLFSIYLVITKWEEDRQTAYIFVFFAVLGIFMYFFRRKFRKKMEEHKKNQ